MKGFVCIMADHVRLHAFAQGRMNLQHGAPFGSERPLVHVAGPCDRTHVEQT